MNKVIYSKQIQSFANQICILKKRGMTFANESQAEEWLKRVSYYRMSGYWYPLLADRENHIFKPGSTFEQACLLYSFDSQLRRLILSYIEKIEVALRTQIAYVLSMSKGETGLRMRPSFLIRYNMPKVCKASMMNLIAAMNSLFVLSNANIPIRCHHPG